ncbi:putative transmembrane protein [Toxoplasma gondii RUB]|uniref:Putative transmembrane protein n=1 Tax=Toxoplasma gondii RUB TaxID=935652 RepID=A0A086MBT5_TOXGO|nr:putative transmembrane protein [Toxoplasma gondii RUB]
MYMYVYTHTGVGLAPVWVTVYACEYKLRNRSLYRRRSACLFEADNFSDVSTPSARNTAAVEQKKYTTLSTQSDAYEQLQPCAHVDSNKQPQKHYFHLHAPKSLGITPHIHEYVATPCGIESTTCVYIC